MPSQLITGKDDAEIQARMEGLSRDIEAARLFGKYRKERQAAADAPGEPIMLRAGQGKNASLVPCRLIADGLVLMPNGMARAPFKVRLNKKERMRARRAEAEKAMRKFLTHANHAQPK